MPVKNSTIRRLCITLNNYTEDEVILFKRRFTELGKYGIIGREHNVGNEPGGIAEGTPHLQAYINLSKPTKFNTLRLAFPRAHIEQANGSEDENIAYCSKEDEQPWTFGVPGGQGRRTDLEDAANIIRDGGSMRDVAIAQPSAFIRYHRGLRAYQEMVLPATPRDFKTRVSVLCGPTRTGKSTAAAVLANIGGNGIYYKMRGEWWDGYSQQDSVIIDDFYGWLKWDELLKICDRYPYRVPIKGGFEVFNSKHIVITSNITIDQWYKFINYHPEPLYARLNKYMWCEADTWYNVQVRINF